MKIIYIPLLIILIFLECGLNSISFELFFSDSLITAYSIALILGILMIGGAHISAGLLSRAQHKNVEQNFTASYLIIIFIFLVSFIVMWILSVFKQEYIDFIINNSESLENASTSGLFNLSIEGYTHLIGNIAIFAVAFIASFYHHNKKIN